MTTTNSSRVLARFFASALFAAAAFLFISTQAFAATEVVSADTSAGENQTGWLFNRDTETQSPFEFNFDQKSIGDGSLFVPAITNTSANGGKDKFIAEDFLLAPIANIQSISYDFLTLDEADAGQFYMSVYANFGTSSPTKFYDCRYNVIPTTGSSANFTTVTFDPSQAYTVATHGTSPEACPAVPADMDTASSTGATIRVIAINVGDTTDSDTGVSGYLDNVVVTRTDGIVVTDFDPEPLPACDTSTFDTFTTGSVNGQGDWSATGPYDQEVVSNIYGFDSFGCQSLRVSNAVTSGSFGDWIFTPLLPEGVGEASSSVDALDDHFEVEFNIATVQPDEQSGLQVSVAPDNGNGGRMSYLRFEDQSDGIHVFFDDVPSTTTPITWDETDIATLSRTEEHTIKITLDVVDGMSNDIVHVYIDGSNVHTGTSWENYYWTDISGEVTNHVPQVIRGMIIQARGNGSSDNHAELAGKGFLFDNVVLDSSLNQPTPTPSNGGGGGGNGSRVSLTDDEEAEEEETGEEETETPEGQVLGEATSTPVVYYSFLVDFGMGTENTDVTNLQTILIAAGYLDIDAPTGFFGPLTFAALTQYQAAHGIPATGFVGPLTRSQLNTEPVVADPLALKIADLLAQVAALQAQLDALNAQ